METTNTGNIEKSFQKNVPVGVKIISILYYIGAVFGIIFGLLLIFGAETFTSILNGVLLIDALDSGLSGLFIAGGIIMIALGVLGFFIGRGLWKGRNWARIFVIILSILGVLIGVFSMVQGDVAGNIFGLAVNLIIGGYLLFSRKVKEAFVQAL